MPVRIRTSLRRWGGQGREAGRSLRVYPQVASAEGGGREARWEVACVSQASSSGEAGQEWMDSGLCLEARLAGGWEV